MSAHSCVAMETAESYKAMRANRVADARAILHDMEVHGELISEKAIEAAGRLCGYFEEFFAEPSNPPDLYISG